MQVDLLLNSNSELETSAYRYITQTSYTNLPSLIRLRHTNQMNIPTRTKLSTGTSLSKKLTREIKISYLVIRPILRSNHRY